MLVSKKSSRRLYRIYDKDDIDILKNKCNPNDIFILKKIWGESRNGLKLASSR